MKRFLKILSIISMVITFIIGVFIIIVNLKESLMLKKVEYDDDYDDYFEDLDIAREFD